MLRGTSGKLFNDANGLIWPTEGCFFAPAGLRCGPLVVSPDHGVARALPADAKKQSNGFILSNCALAGGGARNDHGHGAAVLRPARFRIAQRHRALLAVGNRVQTRGIDTLAYQI